MKVAFIFLHPFSGSLGSTVRVRELAFSLHKYGVESYILTPYEESHSISEGVNVVSIGDVIQKLGLSDYFYKVTRSAYYSRFFIRHFMINRRFQVKLAKRLTKVIMSVLERLNVDVIQAEQDVALPTAIEVKKETNLPILVDLHNITSEELVAAHVIERESKEFCGLQRLLHDVLQEMDSVAVVSNEMKDYVTTNYGISSKHVVVVPPGGRPRIRDLEIYKKADPPKVVYSGLVAYREHVDLFVRSMSIVRSKLGKAKFYVTDKGEALSEMRRLAEEMGVSPVYFWFPGEEDFYKFLSSCHVGALPSSNDLARRMGTPVKLFDYLSVGLPVVANDIGSWSNLIKEEGVGLLANDDPKDFAQGILALLNDSEMLFEFGEKCLKLVKTKFNWANSAEKLHQTYVRLIS